MTRGIGGVVSLEGMATELMVCGLAAIVEADFGHRPSAATQYLRESARYLGLLGLGDPERLNLIGWRWEVANVVPELADQDRQELNVQVAELVPGWFS